MLAQSSNQNRSHPRTDFPVRVAFVIDNLSRAGTESQLVALLEGLDRTRVAPSLVLLDGTAAASRVLEPAGVPVLRLGVTRLIGSAGVRGALRLAAHWRDVRPDIVQAYFLDSAYLAAPVARLVGVSKFIRVRNNLGYWLTPKHRIMNRLLAPLVTTTLTNSAAGRAALVTADGLPPSRVEVLENGVDLERYAESAPPFSTNILRVGCVANLRPVKNLGGLLRAARQVCAVRPDARFAIAGDGPQRAELESLAAGLGLAGKVTFLGAVCDVPSFLGQIDVAVVPSHSEGMSNALLEYLAAGRAVVATDVGANADLCGPDGGVIVTPGDDAALAQAILELASDPERARGRAAAGRVRVEARFGRAAMCDRFAAFYERLVPQRVAYRGDSADGGAVNDSKNARSAAWSAAGNPSNFTRTELASPRCC